MGAPTFSEKCNGSKTVSPISGNPNHYSLGMQLDLAKMNSPAFKRTSCTFRMPVKLNEKQKLVITNIEHDVQLSAGQGVESKSSLEIFLAGQKSTPLQLQIKGIDSTQRVAKKLKTDGIVSESLCGQEIIVAGNLTASIVGSGKGSASTSPVLLTMEIVNCL